MHGWSSSDFHHYNFQRDLSECNSKSCIFKFIGTRLSKNILITPLMNNNNLNYLSDSYTYAHQHPSIHSSGPCPMPDPSCVYLGWRFGRCDRGPQCRGESCMFAHSKEELRVWNRQLEQFKEDMQGELKTYFPPPRFVWLRWLLTDITVTDCCYYKCRRECSSTICPPSLSCLGFAKNEHVWTQPNLHNVA